MEEWENQVSAIIECFSKISGIKASRSFPGERGIQPIWIPRVQIEWSSQVNHRSPNEIKQLLIDGTPRVAVDSNNKGLVVNPQMLQQGQEQVVADYIKNALLK